VDIIIWNAKRHCQSENGVANYRHSRTGKLNSLYFGQQTAKNMTRVLTHPTGGHHIGHCHTSSFHLFLILHQHKLVKKLWMAFDKTQTIGL